MYYASSINKNAHTAEDRSNTTHTKMKAWHMVDKDMRWFFVSTCWWSRYRSLQCSLCPRWQRTQACTDNGRASSEKSVSNCLWCWPTHRQNHVDRHADGVKTGGFRWHSIITARQESNCTVSGAERRWARIFGWHDPGWRACEVHSDTRWQFGNTRTHTVTQVVLTSWTFSLALMSDGWTREPMTFRLPWTTRASSGRSVLIPTLPWWYTESGSWPRCHSTSLSLSNWPGLDACRRQRRGCTDKLCFRCFREKRSTKQTPVHLKK